MARPLAKHLPTFHSLAQSQFVVQLLNKFKGKVAATSPLIKYGRLACLLQLSSATVTHPWRPVKIKTNEVHIALATILSKSSPCSFPRTAWKADGGPHLFQQITGWFKFTPKQIPFSPYNHSNATLCLEMSVLRVGRPAGSRLGAIGVASVASQREKRGSNHRPTERANFQSDLTCRS